MVVGEDAHKRNMIEVKESIKKQIQSIFKSNPLPMHRNLLKKQVIKAQSNKHSKAKPVQLQDFQHKEGNFILLRCIKPCFPLS